MERIAVRIMIRGRVQGVGYRWWAKGEASRLKLDGWVRNRGDGAVELLAIGPEPAVERLLKSCRTGPSAAEVKSIERFEAEIEDLAGFDQRPTV